MGVIYLTTFKIFEIISRYTQEFWKFNKKQNFHHQLIKVNCVKSNNIKKNKLINKKLLNIIIAYA